MPDPTPLPIGLEDGLRSYFAATTSTGLPRAVRDLSARTLSRRRTRWADATPWMASAAAVAAIVLVVVLGRGGRTATTGSESQTGLQPGAGAAAVAPAPVLLQYPGVDVQELAGSGPTLLDPAGHGTPLLAAASAQGTAVSAVGSGAGSPGPAELAYARLGRTSAAPTCLCWVVDVPVNTGASAATARTELVLVDARTGRVVAALTGNGIP